MLARENVVVLASALATLAALGALALLEYAVGLPGEWAVVLGFVLVVAIGFALPQAYLLRVDESAARRSRLGVVTLVLVVLASVFAGATSGTESRVVLAIASLSIAAVFGLEARTGYRDSVASDDA